MNFDLSKRHCYYFNELAKIPHGSKNEKAISDYIVNKAKELGLRYLQDEMFNVIVYKDGTNNSTSPVILQAHIDMVAEKNNDSDHDFNVDGLKLEVNDGYLSAKGTTLGADDGHGVSYMLRIMEDNTLLHPPLELVFTVQEEIGLYGVMNLKKEYFKANRMIGLDGSGENITAISSSGGCRVDLISELKYQDNTFNTYSISVLGLNGGHSGGCIHLERGNSNKIAFRILKELQLANIDLTLVDIYGGLKDNAIPREAFITISCNNNINEIEEIFNTTTSNIKNELKDSEDNLTFKLEQINIADKKLDQEISNNIINAFYLSYNGFLHKSLTIKDLTTVSLNLGILSIKENKLVGTFSLRSPIASAIDNLINHLKVIANTFNLDINTKARYPGYDYNPKSKMRDLLSEVYKNDFNMELKTEATHGGLEIGVFDSLVDNLDVVTLGPKTYDIHTPYEKMDLESFDKVEKILIKFLEVL